jgi:hypothetical protein
VKSERGRKERGWLGRDGCCRSVARESLRFTVLDDQALDVRDGEIVMSCNLSKGPTGIEHYDEVFCVHYVLHG